MEKLRIDYIIDKQTIDEDSIDEFELMARRRRLREEQVKRIKRMILNGKHFDSPLIVNESEDKKRILDGQHRISAISRIIKDNPNFQIEVIIIKYKDLTPEEEKEMFVRWNSGTRQSSEDFIQIHLDDIKIYEMFKEFPVEVTIYRGEEGSVPFRNLVEPYIFTRLQQMLKNTLGPIKFVEEAKKLGEEDYLWIKKFIEEFIREVGGFNKKNIFCRIGGISPIMFLYANGNLKPKEFWERFQKIKSNKKIKEIIDIGGFAAKKKVRDLMAEKMEMEFKEKEIKIGRVGRENPFTEEHIKWLRKNWPRTAWNISDLTEEFNEKFGTQTQEPAIRWIMTKNKIKKDPKFRNKGNKRASVFTKEVSDFMRKCATTMTAYETHDALQKEFEHMFVRTTMIAFAKTNDILFKKHGIQPENISTNQMEIIKKYKNKPIWEIESKIIEELGEKPKEGVIHVGLRSLGVKSKNEQKEDKFEDDKMGLLEAPRGEYGDED